MRGRADARDGDAPVDAEALSDMHLPTPPRVSGGDYEMPAARDKHHAGVLLHDAKG